MVSDSCRHDCCRQNSFLRAAASCQSFQDKENSGATLPFSSSQIHCCPRCLHQLSVPGLPVQYTYSNIILERAVRLLSSIARRSELVAYRACLYCQTHARRVQASSSLSPMPPQITGLHFPHTSKSRAGLLTANTALIQHIEMPRKSGLGTTSLVPA